MIDIERQMRPNPFTHMEDLPGCTAFRPLCLKQGDNTVSVAVTGTSGVTVDVRARGRW